MTYGATFSHKRIDSFGLDRKKCLEEILQLKLATLRLGCYWNQIEKKAGEYDFSDITSLLDICEENKQRVVVTIGMKAPDWPEYYIPAWLERVDEQILYSNLEKFLQQAVNVLKKYTCITVWQIENEPMDESGPHKRTISKQFLQREVQLVRSLDSRKILLTAWGNDLTKRMCIPDLAELGDIIGIDIYYKQFFTKQLSFSLYKGPSDSSKTITSCMQQTKRPYWITELQAEPWEADSETYRSEDPKSMNEKVLSNNIEKAKSLHPEMILFWGAEYWLWRKSQGDDRLWKTIQEVINETS